MICRMVSRTATSALIPITMGTVMRMVLESPASETTSDETVIRNAHHKKRAEGSGETADLSSNKKKKCGASAAEHSGREGAIFILTLMVAAALSSSLHHNLQIR